MKKQRSVVAILEAKPDKEKELEFELQNIVGLSRAE